MSNFNNKRAYFGLLVLLASGCSSSSLEFVEGPTSSLKPDQVEEITEESKLGKKMFTSVLTRLKYGNISAIIQTNSDNQLQMAINHSDKSLHELCRARENCLGGVYASVHNNNGKGEIFHRVHKGNRMKVACAWIESYSSEFEAMSEQLQKDVIGRAWHWIKVCFDE